MKVSLKVVQAVTVYVASDRDWELWKVMTLRANGKLQLIFLIKKGLETLKNNLHLEKGLLESFVLAHFWSSTRFNNLSCNFILFILFIDSVFKVCTKAHSFRSSVFYYVKFIKINLLQLKQNLLMRLKESQEKEKTKTFEHWRKLEFQRESYSTQTTSLELGEEQNKNIQTLSNKRMKRKFAFTVLISLALRLDWIVCLAELYLSSCHVLSRTKKEVLKHVPPGGFWNDSFAADSPPFSKKDCKNYHLNSALWSNNPQTPTNTLKFVQSYSESCSTG